MNLNKKSMENQWKFIEIQWNSRIFFIFLLKLSTFLLNYNKFLIFQSGAF